MSLAVMTDGGSGGGGGGVKLAIMASNSISTARRGALRAASGMWQHWPIVARRAAIRQAVEEAELRHRTAQQGGQALWWQLPCRGQGPCAAQGQHPGCARLGLGRREAREGQH